MMSQPIFDMRAIAAQQLFTDHPSQGVLDKLLDCLVHLPDASREDMTEEVLDRAASYDASQPSFAQDLRAAVAGREDEAVV